ncbi:glycoside hydrolase family 28 protein [Paenibacillus sepulcri]|uniref:Glycoside hydrolase family 28 protein n=1 Tax=Paenibacillus sepulcri TaxID=359917 RepID=A0ABS7C385_9BACL|nr:glycoside hydrolase family 28 protein [Paenibacillus sepulcri]
MRRNEVFLVNDYGAAADGDTLATASIQEAIDAAWGAGGGRIEFAPGSYLTGALFLKSNVQLHLAEGVVLRGAAGEEDYPELWSRVAGIEMNWYSALINICGQENASITGKGTIDGQGNCWWDKYWSMRKVYTEQGLRWVVDYDCKRPRNIQVIDSSRIELKDFTSLRSGFWNVHICYSEHVTVSGLTIRDNQGPSTDGIDIDSSSHVLVENCFIDCNDDNLCIKAGRDADGLRVNRPAEDIVIRNCITGAGAGITLGSETSGGIRNVEIYNIKSVGTSNGLRFKSARNRGGLIENIRVHNLDMIDVRNPFGFLLNWNPSYSYAQIPETWEGEVPVHWQVLAEPVLPEQRGIPEFRNVEIANVTVRNNLLPGSGRPVSYAFEVEAYPEKPISGIRLSNILIESHAAGTISHAKDWTMNDVVIRTLDGVNVRLNHCDSVDLPEVERFAPKALEDS